MIALPFESLTYRTKLTKEQVNKKLQACLEPIPRSFRVGLLRKPTTNTYEGELSGDCFNIQRIIIYRNSFLPTITGCIQQDQLGTTIKIRMRLNMVVMILLLLWCWIIVPLSLTSVVVAIRDNGFTNQTFIPLTLLVFTYSITMTGFKFESRRSKLSLQRLFEADMIE